jgi:hypothetical protein
VLVLTTNVQREDMMVAQPSPTGGTMALMTDRTGDLPQLTPHHFAQLMLVMKICRYKVHM